ncbi:hypothetical protein HGRIS_001400 [Hohenbuehelia grisea]|uniref:Uncharacterized protein n=1 Tax=Hohenbuehelia grisea TaxID=104357 RepID=A0ABR3JP65_9AGAR
MGILFDNQIGTLNKIRVLDDEEAAGTERFSIREWLRPTMSEGDHTVMDGIAVRMPLKYARSSDASPKSKLTRITKRAIPSERATPSADKGAPGVGDEPPVRAPSCEYSLMSYISIFFAESLLTAPRVRPEEEVRLGALYDPALLPDFGGPFFDMKESRLVQHDVRDVDGSLIPPRNVDASRSLLHELDAVAEEETGGMEISNPSRMPHTSNGFQLGARNVSLLLRLQHLAKAPLQLQPHLGMTTRRPIALMLLVIWLQILVYPNACYYIFLFSLASSCSASGVCTNYRAAIQGGQG